ncbi:unnamed protein product [Blepharisma stoltei]|uniref:Uncharacterized protein n=1 Tax=Blepharisma stoltei TaxID=1481888 RepID=A0AAU9IU87_9CILI|nr:unnamed protein product [Blepharisma stoltei]
MDIKEIVKTVSPPLISRYGKTLTFSLAYKTDRKKDHSITPKSFTYSDLKKELAKVQQEIMDQEIQTSGKGQMTSSFKCQSRIQREKVLSGKIEDVPTATQYSPLFTIVKPKVIGGCLARSSTATPRKQRIHLPSCLNHELECIYPKKSVINTDTHKNRIDANEYENLIQKISRIKRRKTPELPKQHVPEVDFNKQTERKYIPLNLVNEARFETKRDPFLRNSSPDFAKFSERKYSVTKDDIGFYNAKFEFVRARITQDIDFSKTSPRLSIFEMRSKTPDRTNSTAITNT